MLGQLLRPELLFFYLYAQIDKALKTTQKKIYFENLDALRFFSFLAVFFFHSFHTEFEYIKNEKLYGFLTKFLFANGNLGVNFFLF